MKNLRNVLAGLAVVFAFGVALAAGNYNGAPDYGDSIEEEQCLAGTLRETQLNQCTDFVTPTRCTVEITSTSEIVEAWDDESGVVCAIPLYKQF